MKLPVCLHPCETIPRLSWQPWCQRREMRCGYDYGHGSWRMHHISSTQTHDRRTSEEAKKNKNAHKVWYIFSHVWEKCCFRQTRVYGSRCSLIKLENNLPSFKINVKHLTKLYLLWPRQAVQTFLRGLLVVYSLNLEFIMYNLLSYRLQNNTNTTWYSWHRV